MESPPSPWLKWAALMAPALAMLLSWPRTAGLPWINRVAVGVAVALVVFALVHFAIKRSGRRDR